MTKNFYAMVAAAVIALASTSASAAPLSGDGLKVSADQLNLVTNTQATPAKPAAKPAAAPAKKAAPKKAKKKKAKKKKAKKKKAKKAPKKAAPAKKAAAPKKS